MIDRKPRYSVNIGSQIKLAPLGYMQLLFSLKLLLLKYEQLSPQSL